MSRRRGPLGEGREPAGWAETAILLQTSAASPTRFAVLHGMRRRREAFDRRLRARVIGFVTLDALVRCRAEPMTYRAGAGTPRRHKAPVGGTVDGVHGRCGGAALRTGRLARWPVRRPTSARFGDARRCDESSIITRFGWKSKGARSGGDHCGPVLQSSRSWALMALLW